MRKARTRIIPLLAALALSPLACSTTTFESTWRSPEAQPLRLQGQKVVGLFLSNSSARRRTAEDAMAREISARGAQGVPAYTVLSDEEVKDQETARAKLDKLGFGGVVVMRVVVAFVLQSKTPREEALIAGGEQRPKSGEFHE